jgi:hypothetical protein
MGFLLILSLCICYALCSNSVAENLKAQTLEQQRTAAAKMNFDNYKLYPFAISKKQ